MQPTQPHLHTEATRDLTSSKRQLRCALALTSGVGKRNGPGIECTVMSQLSRLNMMELGTSLNGRGVFVTVGFVRGNAHWRVPIQLSSSYSGQLFFAGALLPLAFIGAVKRGFFSKTWWSPDGGNNRDGSTAGAGESAEAAALNLVAAKIDKALTQQRLMKFGEERIRADETAKGGLVILKAEFGAGEHTMDVRIPLQFMVLDSKLRLSVGPKDAYLGIANPCPQSADLPTRLDVTYSFGGYVYSDSLRGDAAVFLPSAHATRLGPVSTVSV